MKSLYIIGNGLDIAMGLKTAYPDFYEYYVKQPSTDENIALLKDSIKKEAYETWADLEIGLGTFSSQCSSEQAFMSCLDDIREHLRSYLADQEAKRKPVMGFSEFLRHPENYIEPDDIRLYNRFAWDHRKLENSLSLVTLNYTSTIESLIDSTVVEPFHIHGQLSNMVIGVNDESQISNPVLANSVEFREEFVKPVYNTACRNARNEDFSYMITQADIFVIYGASMGLSDKKWWQAIGKRLMSGDAVLFFFPYDSKKDVIRHENYLRRWTNAYYAELMAKLEIDAEQIPQLRDSVFIGINKTIIKPISVTISAETTITQTK